MARHSRHSVRESENVQIGTPAPPPAAPQGREHLPAGEHRHEESDISARVIAYVGLALIVGAFALHAGLFGYLKALTMIEPPTPQRTQSTLTLQSPEPRLEVDEIADLLKIRAHEDANLSSYVWVNKTAGVVRIPVARAMELAAQRGLPKWGGDVSKSPDEARFGGKDEPLEPTPTK